eukprot:SAG31_NODE_894_length_11172_cov_25.790572_7_plen_85_part_00
MRIKFSMAIIHMMMPIMHAAAARRRAHAGAHVGTGVKSHHLFDRRWYVVVLVIIMFFAVFRVDQRVVANTLVDGLECLWKGFDS